MTTQTTTPDAQAAASAGGTTQTAGAAGTQQQASTTQQASTATSTDGQAAAGTASAELEIKLPEGAKVDEKLLGEFKKKAKEWGFNSKQAQSLVEFQLASQAAAEKEFKETFEKQRQADIDALKADKEFGGPKYDATVKAAQNATKRFFGEEGSKLFTELGIDNHPGLVKGLARLNAAIAEDSIDGTVTSVASGTNTEEQRLRQMMPKSYDQIVKKGGGASR